MISHTALPDVLSPTAHASPDTAHGATPDHTPTVPSHTLSDAWLAALHDIPCAAYVVKNDAELTLLGGNAAFYALLGCTSDELRTRYANRLDALLDAESLHALTAALQKDTTDAASPASLSHAPLRLKLRVKIRDAHIWMDTEVRLAPDTSGSATASDATPTAPDAASGDDATLLRCISVDITDYENSQRRLTQFEASFQLAIGQLGLDYFEYDVLSGTARILSGLAVLPPLPTDEHGFCTLFAERLIAVNFVCPEDVEKFRQAFRDVSRGAACPPQHRERGQTRRLERGPSQSNTQGKIVCEFQAQRPGGDPLWVRLTLALCQGGPVPGLHAAGALENITARTEAARNYLNETQFYQAILAEKDAYAQVDVTLDKITRIGGMWNLYNEVIHKVSYSQVADEFIHKIVHPDDRKHYLEVMQRENFIQSLHNGIDRLGCEFRRIVDQNKMVWMQLNVHLFLDPLTHHVLALLTIKNIHERKQQELLLLHDSRLDQLTNTFNRKVSETLVREYLSQMRPTELCAFVLLDVDNFKNINDTRGHSAGDDVLTRLSDILTHTFRRHDIIGRFGGDEFILFLQDVQDRRSVEDRLSMLYTRLWEEKESGPIACSAGVALTHGLITYDELFEQADVALYHAKAVGKNCFCFYEDTSQEDRSRLETHSPSRRRQQELEHPRDKGMVLPEDAPCDDNALAPPAHAKSSQPSGSTALSSIPLVRAHPPAAFAHVAHPPHPTSSASFDVFLGEQGDIAYLVDPDTFDLICGNKAFYDRLGMTEAQCAGVKCYEVMHKRETPCPFCSKANWSRDKFYLWKNLNPTLEQEFLIKNKLLPWRGREMLLAIAVDISNNKSIVDSMSSGSEELHAILSGVQHMAAAPSLVAAMHSALETIGSFFMANAVRFWQRGPQGAYTCVEAWICGKNVEQDLGTHEVNAWLEGRTWSQPLVLESPEAMLCYSYDMYRYMKARHIRNQRWLQVRQHNEELGYISIDNISSNFLNNAFLESFMVFIAAELKKRQLMEIALHADHHDALTDLLSRKSFERYMAEYRADEVASLGVAMTNFNNLKGINAAHGFQAGNYFIRQFANMMRDVFEGHPVFRLNGDEFLAIVPEVTRTELDAKLSELERHMSENDAFTVSMGCSWDDVEKDMAALIEEATAAMKVNKKRHYDATPASYGAERRRMLSDLITALENRDYEVYLQPKVELVHASVVGAEALIRYRDKDLGMVPPAHFIDRLEKNHLIRYIDLFVFEEVCRLLEKWKQQGQSLPVVSLNFSRLTLLERDMQASVENIIHRYDAPRTNIEIEITESVADMGKSFIYQAACGLYKAGFGISLDDFGTKYTNLSMLADLDFSKLKLDRSLTSRLGDRMHTLIMKNIIRMCAELGIEVVAEGIETKQQESILRELQCRMGQGYLYGKPVPVSEFERKYIHALPPQNGA